MCPHVVDFSCVIQEMLAQAGPRWVLYYKGGKIGLLGELTVMAMHRGALAKSPGAVKA